MVVDLGPSQIVLDGEPAPPKGRSPQFLIHVRCSETAGWIKIPSGTEVGLGPGDIVLWGPSSPSPKRGHSSRTQFSAHVLWTNGWMDQDALGTKVGLSPGHIALDGDPAPPPPKGEQLPIFGPCSLWPNG